MAIQATRDQFIEALRRLTEEQRFGLLSVGAYYASGHSGFTCADDLLNEVIVRVADGRRNWPIEVELETFLINAMRSVVNTTRQRADMARDRVSLDADDDGDEWRPSPPIGFHPSTEDEAIRAERHNMGREAIDFARRTLAGDQDGLNVLEGLAADLSPADMREAFGIGQAQFHAARQRVMARLGVWARARPQ